MTRERFMELTYFAHQYYQWKSDVARLTLLTGQNFTWGGKSVKDPTYEKALELGVLKSKIFLVEKSAKQIGIDMRELLKKRTTDPDWIQFIYALDGEQ